MGDIGPVQQRFDVLAVPAGTTADAFAPLPSAPRSHDRPEGMTLEPDEASDLRRTDSLYPR